jgi:spermidine/putrescine transport system substrate-binding protein
MKKRIFAFLLCAVLVAAAFPFPAHAASNEITVYNWGQYIDDGSDGTLDVLAEFTKETGIKVNYLTYDSNESLYTKLKTGGTTFDVIIPSDYMIGKLKEEDMLEKLDFDNIPNYKYIDESFRNQAYDPKNEYSVPYTWGTVGLIYNKKYVSDADAKSWSCLWNAKYAGKMLIFDNCRDSFAIAESMLGYSLNTEDSSELRACSDLLSTQKSLLQGYVMDQIFDKMERAEAWIAPYYAGDYLTMVAENPQLGFSFPKEGFNIFIDALCIPKGCQNKAGAEAFINFLCKPEISGQNLEFLGYSTPETEAKQYMSADVTSSPIAYPDQETLSRSEAFGNLSVQATQEMNDLWLQVKTSGNNTTVYLVLTLAAVAAVILIFVISGVDKKRRKERRCQKWKTQ